MSRTTQDRATTERFTRTLRELVKQPDNKFCADCKHNDPRWASWNLGVFLCIRCSGIHRGMGTHISKVKSVDLDTWTPEQMESIQKWGNRRANLYWEARLKAGHVPPDHKMESFIRSKYEARRWAMDGPPPQDPSVLESDAAVPENTAQPAPATQATPDPIGWGTPSPPRTSTSTVNRQPQPRQLLSAGHAPNAPLMKPPTRQAAASAPAPPPQPKPQEDLFSLDFHAPATTPAPASPPAQKNAKNDIMSLFSTPAAAPTQQFGQFQQQPAQASPWGAPAQQQAQPQSLMGNNGTGMWGASSGWSSPQQQQQPPQSSLWAGAPQQPQQSNVWGAPAVPQHNAFAAATADTNVWGATAPAGGDLFAQPAQPKKDDAFGDLWGGFK